MGFLPRPDSSLLVTPDLVSASEQNPLHGNWAHGPHRVTKAAFDIQSPSSPCTFPQMRDSALLGVSPKYLHTLSKTDPVKLLMVTSTSSTGKKNEVQMEVAQLAMGDLELSMYSLKPQSPHLWLGTAPAS